MKSRLLILAIVAVTAITGDLLLFRSKPAAVVPKVTAEAPPKVKKAVLKATVKVEGKPDRVIVFKELTPKIVDEIYVEPKNTADNHSVLVPHQVLDQVTAAPPKPTHSVLKKTVIRDEGTCTTGSCSRNNDSNWQGNSNNYGGNGNRFSFGGFGGGGRFGF